MRVLILDIYEHELAAYSVEIEEIKRCINQLAHNPDSEDNLTHLSLGVSNRQNMLLVGLCSLVEIILFEYAHRVKESNQLQMDEAKKGYLKFQDYLKSTGSIDFGRLKGWDKFKQIYTLRNVIIHSYGGLLETSQLEKARNAVRILKTPEVLVADRRIRVNSENLQTFYEVISLVVRGLSESMKLHEQSTVENRM